MPDADGLTSEILLFLLFISSQLAIASLVFPRKKERERESPALCLLDFVCRDSSLRIDSHDSRLLVSEFEITRDKLVRRFLNPETRFTRVNILLSGNPSSYASRRTLAIFIQPQMQINIRPAGNRITMTMRPRSLRAV